MEFYKHDVFFENRKIEKGDIKIDSIKKDITYRNKLYALVDSFENNEYFSFWYKRYKDIVKENGIYIDLKTNKRLENSELKHIKEEYNYFVILKYSNSSLLTYDTTDTSVTVNKSVIERFLNISSIQIENEIDQEKFNKLNIKSVKFSKKKGKRQSTIYGSDSIGDTLKNHIQEIFDADAYELKLTSFYKKDKIKGLFSNLNSIVTHFKIEAYDEQSKFIKIDNKKISAITKLFEEEIEMDNPLNIFEKIKEVLDA